MTTEDVQAFNRGRFVGVVSGIFIGIGIVFIINFIDGQLPFQKDRTFQQTIVKMGHVKWISNTNGIPVFNWNKPCNDKE